MKELLRWLDAKSKKGDGASVGEIITYVMSEITSLGASQRTAKGYIETLSKLGFISVYRLRWKTTEKGQNWLARKKEL